MKNKAPAEWVWMDGKIVPWEEARVHVRTETAMRGANVFEGVRAYWNAREEELYIFKLSEHLDRLFDSMKIMRMTIPYTKDDLAKACIELLARNNFRGEVHFRPTVYFGEGEDYGWKPDRIFTGTVITGVSRPQKETLQKGYHVQVSSWRRISDSSVPPRVKAGANYQNSRLALVQAKIDGYDYAILLNEQGKVSEGAGACLFMVRDGVAITPPVTADILEGITRSTFIQLYRDELGVQAVEREMDRTELYIADEVFLCGSGQEVVPVVSIDRYVIGDGTPGPLTRKIQETYFSIARGEVPKYRRWLTPVYASQKVAQKL